MAMKVGYIARLTFDNQADARYGRLHRGERKAILGQEGQQVCGEAAAGRDWGDDRGPVSFNLDISS